LNKSNQQFNLHFESGEALQKFRVASTSSTSNASANSQTRSGDTAINSDDQDKSPRASSDLPELSRQYQQLMARLEKMKGSQFDREYLTAMVNGHREAVRLFEQEAGINSSDSSTASKSQTGLSTPGQRSSTERGSIDTAERTTPTSNTATDSKNLAAEILPTIKHHLQEAENLRKTIK
jgi:predicted outer membrane protein